MAIQTAIPRANGRFRGMPAAGNRIRAFRAAKRHSAIVRTLRFLLPVAVLAIGGLYFRPTQITVQTDAGEATIQDVTIAKDGLKMINPRIKGVHEKQGQYDIQAEDATQQIKNPELITLNKINGTLTAPSGEKTTLTAPSGIYHSKQEELIFDKGVVVNGEAGMSGKLQYATGYFKKNMLVSNNPVELTFHSSTINAQSMTLYSAENRVIFKGKVKVHLERRKEGNGQ